MRTTVELHYFTNEGKWYSSGEYESQLPGHAITDEVRLIREEYKLPGLSSGHWSGLILVRNVDENNDDGEWVFAIVLSANELPF